MSRNTWNGSFIRSVRCVVSALCVLLCASCATASGVRREAETVRIYCNFEYVGTEFDEYCISRIEAATGVRPIIESGDVSGYDDKLSQLFLGENLPDAVIFNSHTDKHYISGVYEGLFIPLNDYLADADNIVSHTGAETWKAVKSKGNDEIYMIPRTSIARNDGMVLRKDWLDALGIEAPPDGILTRSQFTHILERFTNGDPDGNGIDDTYGLMPYPAYTGYLQPLISGSFDCLGWQKSDGEYEYMDASVEPGNTDYKAALSYTAELWRLGYIDPDWPILNKDESDQFMFGRVGATECFGGHALDRQTNLRKNVPGAEVTYIYGVANDGGVLHGVAQYPGLFGGIAITKAAKNPENIIKVLDYILSDEGWQLANYGKAGYAQVLPGVPEKFADEAGSIWMTALMRRADDVGFFFNQSYPEEELAKTREWIAGAQDSMIYSCDFGIIPPIAFDEDFMVADAKRREKIMRIIMGELSVQEYDAVLSEWYRNGGETYVRQINQIISTTRVP